MHLRSRILLAAIALLVAVPIFAQQTGAIRGRVLATDGSALPGVTVEARSNVLPQPRVTNTDGAGDYRLPALVPGNYTLTFSLSGMQTSTRKAQVQLGQEITADVKLGVAGVAESITVTAQSTLVDKESTAIQSGLSNEQIQALPVAQEYRDLQKLIPGVTYTQDTVRGPSAGGSGQDNVYLFDGVNVTMPLFGVLNAEPSTHDIAQVNVVKGGAKAVDFERSGGFSIDSVSKTGTNKLSGQVSYQSLSHSFIADQKGGATNSRFQQDRDWTVVNLGGPILQDRLFFYGSYYRPVWTRDNASNLYGSLPGYNSKRNEEFGKLTFTPISSLLINGSYRNSHRIDTGDTFSSTQAATTGQGYDTKLKIGTLEGSWITTQNSFATFKYTDYKAPGGNVPEFLSPATPSLAIGTQLDLANIDTLGRFIVPTPVTGNSAQNAFVQPFIDKYGYVQNGVRTGGGTLGGSLYTHNNDDFFRRNGQAGYNYTLGTNVTHDLHVGYQRYTDAEDLYRISNGWGSVTIPAGTANCRTGTACAGQPIFFQSVFNQQTTGVAPKIHSEFHSQNIELNDTVRMNNWTFNVGLMASNDTLYGQGLKKADNIAGFVTSPGTKYLMHDTPFKDQIQPRLGATWAYNGVDTVYGSYARYFPAANSDARAASWDRAWSTRTIEAYFDQTGKEIGSRLVGGSSGKLFQPGIKPRHTDEYLIGTAQQINNALSARVYTRYRKSVNFWEDTLNDSRILYGKDKGVPQQLFVPDLDAKLAAIGSGSSYVIANLDNAFTKYYEATAESEWHHNNTFIRGSYTWSHYYGNFDQDFTTNATGNDQAIFIGSSNIGDDAGYMLWDNRYGNLRGDRRNLVKVYGTQVLPWKASVGAFWLFQSGQPYQLESYIPYAALTSSRTDSARFAEPAGSRRTPSHHQLDLNYTQNFGLPKGLNLQLLADVFNVYDKQTGYNYEARLGTLGTCTPTTVDPATTTPCPAGYFATGLPGTMAYTKVAPHPLSFYDPRRYQLAVRLQF